MDGKNTWIVISICWFSGKFGKNRCYNWTETWRLRLFHSQPHTFLFQERFWAQTSTRACPNRNPTHLLQLKKSIKVQNDKEGATIVENIFMHSVLWEAKPNIPTKATPVAKVFACESVFQPERKSTHEVTISLRFLFDWLQRNHTSGFPLLFQCGAPRAGEDEGGERNLSRRLSAPFIGTSLMAICCLKGF